MQNITEALTKEIIGRNPAFQLAEDLPQLTGELQVHYSDEFGFSYKAAKIPFEQLNYLLSILISEPLQSTVNDEGQRHHSYSCKLQKCFAHLTEKPGNYSEIVIHQDSDLNPASVNNSVNLANHVNDVVGEVGQEISGLMKKLKAKNKSNPQLEKEFDRLTKILDQNSEEL